MLRGVDGEERSGRACGVSVGFPSLPHRVGTPALKVTIAGTFHHFVRAFFLFAAPFSWWWWWGSSRLRLYGGARWASIHRRPRCHGA